MKKLFTLVLFAMAAFAVQAETVADYVRNIGTFTAGGTCNLSGSVKIHVNKDAVSGIQFANGYTTDGVLNDNYVTVTCEGGFKAGDVITIAGAFNNDDDTKLSAIDIFTANEDKTYNVLFTTQQFINGKHAEGDPVEETFTLEEDVDVLCLGRNGKTGTFITVFKVVRDGEETPLEPEVIPDVEEGVIFDGAMIAANNSKEWVDKFGTIEFFVNTDNPDAKIPSYDGVNIHENKDNVPCILFETSYMKDETLQAYIIVHPNVEGGFKKGDKVSIAGAFNNSDNSKLAGVVLFTPSDDVNILFDTTVDPENPNEDPVSFINGRTSPDDPKVLTYVLEEDVDALYVGRKGNTKTCITTLKIERSGEEPIIEDPTSITAISGNTASAVAFNLAGQQVDATYKGIVIQNGKKAIRK